MSWVEVFKLAMQASLLYAVQPWMALTLPLCAAIVYVLQKIYLRTSRQLRFIELESRSEVNTNFLETVSLPPSLGHRNLIPAFCIADSL